MSNWQYHEKFTVEEDHIMNDLEDAILAGKDEIATEIIKKDSKRAESLRRALLLIALKNVPSAFAIDKIYHNLEKSTNPKQFIKECFVIVKFLIESPKTRLPVFLHRILFDMFTYGHKEIENWSAFKNTDVRTETSNLLCEFERYAEYYERAIDPPNKYTKNLFSGVIDDETGVVGHLMKEDIAIRTMALCNFIIQSDFLKTEYKQKAKTQNFANWKEAEAVGTLDTLEDRDPFTERGEPINSPEFYKAMYKALKKAHRTNKYTDISDYMYGIKHIPKKELYSSKVKQVLQLIGTVYKHLSKTNEAKSVMDDSLDVLEEHRQLFIEKAREDMQRERKDEEEEEEEEEDEDGDDSREEKESEEEEHRHPRAIPIHTKNRIVSGSGVKHRCIKGLEDSSPSPPADIPLTGFGTNYTDTQLLGIIENGILQKSKESFAFEAIRQIGNVEELKKRVMMMTLENFPNPVVVGKVFDDLYKSQFSNDDSVKKVVATVCKYLMKTHATHQPVWLRFVLIETLIASTPELTKYFPIKNENTKEGWLKGAKGYDVYKNAYVKFLTENVKANGENIPHTYKEVFKVRDFYINAFFNWLFYHLLIEEREFSSETRIKKEKINDDHDQQPSKKQKDMWFDSTFNVPTAEDMQSMFDMNELRRLHYPSTMDGLFEYEKMYFSKPYTEEMFKLDTEKGIKFLPSKLMWLLIQAQKNNTTSEFPTIKELESLYTRQEQNKYSEMAFDDELDEDETILPSSSTTSKSGLSEKHSRKYDPVVSTPSPSHTVHDSPTFEEEQEPEKETTYDEPEQQNDEYTDATARSVPHNLLFKMYNDSRKKFLLTFGSDFEKIFNSVNLSYKPLLRAAVDNGYTPYGFYSAMTDQFRKALLMVSKNDSLYMITGDFDKPNLNGTILAETFKEYCIPRLHIEEILTTFKDLKKKEFIVYRSPIKFTEDDFEMWYNSDQNPTFRFYMKKTHFINESNLNFLKDKKDLFDQLLMIILFRYITGYNFKRASAENSFILGDDNIIYSLEDNIRMENSKLRKNIERLYSWRNTAARLSEIYKKNKREITTILNEWSASINLTWDWLEHDISKKNKTKLTEKYYSSVVNEYTRKYIDSTMKSLTSNEKETLDFLKS